MSDQIRVAVIDDHQLYRDGVIRVLTKSGKFEVVGEGGSVAEALRVAAEQSPDIVLLDISMPGDGIAGARAIAAAHPRIKIVMLTASESDSLVSQAMMAGAVGYIVKGVTGPELTRAIADIHRGEGYVSPSLAAKILSQQKSRSANSEPPAPMAELTAREQEIMSHVVHGLTNKEIAQRLSLSETTVKHHVSSIMLKTRARNRTELVRVELGRSLDDDISGSDSGSDPQVN